MTALVAVTLDTAAPAVVLGTPAHAVAGQVISIPYTADEPIDSAELLLPDAREVTLTVTPTVLLGLVPADCPRGDALVRVRDDVANEASYPGIHLSAITVAVELDTTAPTVVFGNVSGNSAGGFLQIAYVSDEPIASAIVSAGARQLVMSVLADRVTVQLPADWPSGFVAIDVADDLDNSRRYPQVVEIEGGVISTAAPIQAATNLGTTIPHRVQPLFWGVTIRSFETVRTTSLVQTRAAGGTNAATATSSRITAARADALVTVAASETAVAAAAVLSSAVTSRVDSTVKHRDGPDIEGLLLGLL